MLSFILLGAVFAFAVPILHMQGKGLVAGRYATNSVLFFWVWTNIALGASGIISAVLARSGTVEAFFEVWPRIRPRWLEPPGTQKPRRARLARFTPRIYHSSSDEGESATAGRRVRSAPAANPAYRIPPVD